MATQDFASVPRPPGVNDAFIEFASKAAGGHKVEAILPAPKGMVTVHARIARAVAEFGDDYIMHLVREPRLPQWFAQSQRTPPFFEYECIKIPVNPDCPADQEIIPPDVLARYAKYDLTGPGLDHVRAHCRTEYARGTLHTDLVCRKEEYRALVPVSEVVDDAGKGVVIAACALRMNADITLTVMTMIYNVAQRILFHLEKHHKIDAIEDPREKRKRFGSVEYAWVPTARDSFDRVLYMRFAPALSRAEDQEVDTTPDESDDTTGPSHLVGKRFVERLFSKAYMEESAKQRGRFAVARSKAPDLAKSLEAAIEMEKEATKEGLY